MEWNLFKQNKDLIEKEFENTNWVQNSGMPPILLEQEAKKLISNLSGQPKPLIKAHLFAFVLDNAQLSEDRQNIFRTKLNHCGILQKLRQVWFEEVLASEELKPLIDEKSKACEVGAWRADFDFGHVCPGWGTLLSKGFPGILNDLQTQLKRGGITEEQKIFYSACEIEYHAVIRLLNRYAQLTEPFDSASYLCLKNLSEGAPQTLYEALQLIIFYHYLYEFVSAGRPRTLGRLDCLLWPFYQADTESGRLNKAQAKELLQYFLFTFWAEKIPFDQPFMLGGAGKDGAEQTNALSYLIVETYNELNIYSPKIHIRVSENTPDSFLRLVLSAIRSGNSSFVFANDEVNISALKRVGITEEEAREYVYIGCYEPAAAGCELPCTGTGSVNLAKAVELVLFGGCDAKTNIQAGCVPNQCISFEAFKNEVKKQITYMAEKAMQAISAFESFYMEINPDPLLSATFPSCIENGKDAYAGGAKYNNSSVEFMCIASLTDALCAVKHFVFDTNKLTLAQLKDILKSNWEGQEHLRREALLLGTKYGNNHALADSLMCDFSSFAASLVNNRPNGRGGVFKAGLFSIDKCHAFGQPSVASTDGRRTGEPFSKNTCAVTTMDKNGVTALIKSVAKMDLAAFPNGSVLDVMLHPTAVADDEGLAAMLSLLKTFFKLGGQSLHGNVFNAEVLKKAQKNPEAYQNLQVRVCGWNAYFVNLTRAEQNEFIKQAEHL